MSRRLTPEEETRIRAVVRGMALLRPDLMAQPPSWRVLLRFVGWATWQRFRMALGFTPVWRR